MVVYVKMAGGAVAAKWKLPTEIQGVVSSRLALIVRVQKLDFGGGEYGQLNQALLRSSAALRAESGESKAAFLWSRQDGLSLM